MRERNRMCSGGLYVALRAGSETTAGREEPPGAWGPQGGITERLA